MFIVFVHAVTSEYYMDSWYDFAHYSVVQTLWLSMKEMK